MMLSAAEQELLKHALNIAICNDVITDENSTEDEVIEAEELDDISRSDFRLLKAQVNIPDLLRRMEL